MSRFFTLCAILLFSIFPVFAGGEEAFSAESCRAEMKSFLDDVLGKNFEILKPAEFRVEIATTTPPTIKVLAKTLADAYVEGFDAEFVEKQFANAPFEDVVTIKCPIKKEQLDDYSTIKTFVAGEVRNFVIAMKMTEWFVKFNEDFYNILDPQWIKLVRDFEKKKKYPKAMWDTFERFFPDATLKILTITVKPYAVLWDGLGAHYDSTMKALSEGVEKSAREFSCGVDITEIVDDTIKKCAEKLAKSSMDYMFALLSPEI